MPGKEHRSGIDPISFGGTLAVSWVFPDEASEATDRLRESMIEGRAFIPALWPVEVGNMLLTATRHGRIAAEE